MRAQNKEAHHFGIVFLQHFADGEEIAQRFRHFFVVHADKAVVQPIFHMAVNQLAVYLVRVAMPLRAAALRDFVFMVRKLQIGAAAVNIEGVAE